MKMWTVASLLCLFLLTACGGGGSSSSTGSAADLSGNWQMVLQFSPTNLKTESGFILQTGKTLAGSVLLSGQTLCPGLGSAQGQVSGSNVALTVDQIAQTVNLTGTMNSDGSSMKGDYSILATGCGRGSTIGTWTADRVKTLKGNYQATLTPFNTSRPAYSAAVMVTQGPNTGASNATLSGTATSSDAPCFSNLTVAGVIGGTAMVFNFLTADGTAVGQFRGTATIDATTLTGTYDFLAEDNVCSGDSGNATMTVQP